MLEGILKGLVQWIYGLFLDIITYCANALLGIMSTDLGFFESSVPIVPSLYQIFVAVGWGLLIGNMAFQSMKAMFAGLGIESESPFILMLRTFLFGTLLIFSKDICDIGLSITRKVINLLGIPSSITLKMPGQSHFTGSSAWLLVIIVGFVLGFQVMKLFFEIAERYVIVAVLTLLMPVGLAMGGSKTTKDISTGYIRTYASMLALTVTNILFLKLILSALSSMPSGNLVLPWSLLVVGLAKAARKADSIISRIGMNPAITGDPLGSGRGMMIAAMAARTIISASGRRGRMPAGNGNATGGNAKGAMPNNNGGKGFNYAGNNGASNTVYNGSVNNGNVNNGGINNGSSHQTGFSKGSKNSTNMSSNNSQRFGSANYNNAKQSGTGFSNTTIGGAGRGSKVNKDRFGIQKDNAKTGAPVKTEAGSTVFKNGKKQPIQKSKNGVNAANGRFGSGIKHNTNPMKNSGKTASGKVQGEKGFKNPKLPNVPSGKGASPDKVRFGSERSSRFNDDNILITREDDNDV